MMSRRFNIWYFGIWGLIIIGLVFIGYSCTPKTDDTMYTPEEVATSEVRTSEPVVIEEDINTLDVQILHGEKHYGRGLYSRVYSIHRNGMEYMYVDEGEGAVIVNLTKDSLEIELLKRKLEIDDKGY